MYPKIEAAPVNVAGARSVANQVAEQISATQEQFNKVLEQLKLEHKAKLEELKSDLGAIRIVIKTEDRLGSVITPTKQSEPQA